METEQKNHRKKIFGLVGKNISYSFSRNYFSNKFNEEKLENCQYLNFDIQSIQELPDIIHKLKPHLKGMNVTIPYKEEIFLHLDKVHKTARKIGAVNTVKITKKGILKGYNTDVFGFENSLKPLLRKHHTKALILGTGGASKAVAYVLKKLEINFLKVSRQPKSKNEISYSELSKEIISQYTIVVNSTPLGTFPNVEMKPKIPYQFITKNHLLYDLVYNPKVSAFLKEGKNKGASIKNGYEMLQLQAEESWRIWHK